MDGNTERRGHRRRRVAIVSRIYRPEASAASLRLGALVDVLRDRGDDVRVLTTRPPADVTATHADEAGVSRWPVLRDRAGYVRGYLQYMSFDIPLFARVLFGRTADVFVCEPPPTTGVILRLASAIRRTPYVYYAADIWSDAAAATNASRLVLRAVRAMERFAMRGAAHVLAVTEGVRGRVEELAPKARVSVVGHGVDLTRFAAEGPAVDVPADVVYVGSASEWHGAEVALDALTSVMADDADVTAAFVGQGSSWPHLQAEAQRRGLSERIAFFDTVSPERAAAWLRSARVSVATLVPGAGYDFAVPTKLYASIAVGTPVVYAGPSGVGAVLEANHLGHASAYDASLLADALREALADTTVTPDPHLVTWARENLSSETVAVKSAVAIDAVSAGRGARSRHPLGNAGID